MRFRETWPTELNSADESLEAPQRARFDAIADLLAVDVSPNHARFFEYFEVLRDGRLRQWQLIDDVAADTRVLADQNANDLDARRMPQGFAQGRQFLIRFVSFDGTKVGCFFRRRTTDFGSYLHRSSTILDGIGSVKGRFPRLPESLDDGSRLRWRVANRRLLWQTGNPDGSDATMSEFEPRPANRADLPEVYALLRAVNLPTAGVSEVFPANYVVIRNGDELIGVAGFESYPPYALLRSLAVAPRYHAGGLGRKLVADRVEAARAHGFRAVYLLTTTAADFFCHLGFERTSREGAPLVVRNSGEFVSICPGSAVCLFMNVE